MSRDENNIAIRTFVVKILEDKMKLCVAVAVLLVATLTPQAQGAGFFEDIGNFLGNFFTSFGEQALNSLAEASETILRNATSATATMLSETGQLALFELGNTLGTKRDLSDFLGQFLQQFNGNLQDALSQALGQAQEVVNVEQQLVNSLLNGVLQPQQVLSLVGGLQGAVQQVGDNLQSSLLSSVTGLLAGKRDAGQVQNLQDGVMQLLLPFLNAINTELGGLTTQVQNLAQALLDDGDAPVSLGNLFSLVNKR